MAMINHPKLHVGFFGKIVVAILGLAGVLIAVLVVSPWIRSMLRPATPPATKPLVVGPIPRPSPEELARPHLKKAEEQAQEAIASYLESVDYYFAQTKKNSQALAKEVLGWQAKFSLIGGRQQLEKFIAQTFRKYAFAPEDLEKLGTTVCQQYQAELESIDNQMLVDLRADLADVPGYDRLLKLDSQEWTRMFQQSVSQLVQRTQEELKAEIFKEVASILIGEVVTQVATRLAISSGILGAGATSGAASLGIGLAAGVVVDHIVGRIYDALYDPVGELTKVIESRIEEVHKQFTYQLRQKLEQQAQQRSEERRAGVLQMLDSPL
jgi:hypothetical protein